MVASCADAHHFHAHLVSYTGAGEKGIQNGRECESLRSKFCIMMCAAICHQVLDTYGEAADSNSASQVGVYPPLGPYRPT